MLAWAVRMRWTSGKSTSLKMPMPNVVVQTIVSATMKTAAAEKTGRQRAASQSNSGNSAVTDTTIVQVSRCRNMISPLIAVSVTSATTPSMRSPRGDGSRVAEARPANSGATVTMPSASEANQWYQVVRTDAVELWNNT